MIRNCLQRSITVTCYNSEELLDQKYGNSYSIMSMYRKEIKSWPQLKNGIQVTSRSFIIFYWSVKASQDQKNGTHRTLQIRFAYCYPNFLRRSEINGFEQSEIMKVNDPSFHKEALDQYTDKKSIKQDNSKKRISSFATN